jgi:RNA polymerase sigma-70 factor (ECF subfamily)
MLGSAFDADDAVQETLLRAGRQRGQLRSAGAEGAWLYRIATNVCLDMLRAAKRRVLPVHLCAPASRPVSPGDALGEDTWVWPVPDALVVKDRDDPAEVAVQRDSIRLAFIAALQLLPPRQRAVLILREVLQWSAAEVAELLDMSVIAVNSALQRARNTMTAGDPQRRSAATEEYSALLDRYVEAFERFDLDGLTSLLHLDATLCMPPYGRWVRGRDEVRAWYAGPGSGCRGSRLCQLTANGSPAFGQYRPGGKAWALHVVEISGGEITAINSFLDTKRLFPLFGLPIQRPV